MLRLFRNKKGQNTAEYAIVIGLVVAAAIAMQIYIKRGIQAKVKDGTDLMTSVTGDTGGGTLASTGQYEPYYMSTNFDVTRGVASTDTVASGGGVTRDLTKEETSRTGTQNIGAAQ
ncbi:MAG: hypothetical protein ABH882_02075 [Candidatus Omnitrophota bacterium]|nr:hypothetical protein [Candidatus Omnitrophota bacterium]MBU1929563.1 hypothetical protein [Candidatus Omnitrophota bacterium]MBU2035743.1 hypothetical protein [Candidatus Omnitrophota bacterium]MBU2221778.1 hypothetical protein [Candidatus Omnitrophota bacterium]